jgi:hypothetical protein
VVVSFTLKRAQSTYTIAGYGSLIGPRPPESQCGVYDTFHDDYPANEMVKGIICRQRNPNEVSERVGAGPEEQQCCIDDGQHCCHGFNVRSFQNEDCHIGSKIQREDREF